MIRRPPRSTLFPTRRSSDLALREIGARAVIVGFGDYRAELERTAPPRTLRSEEHTSELQSRFDLVCRLLLEKKKKTKNTIKIQILNELIKKCMLKRKIRIRN